jgi:hypothetical protein
VAVEVVVIVVVVLGWRYQASPRRSVPKGMIHSHLLLVHRQQKGGAGKKVLISYATMAMYMVISTYLNWTVHSDLGSIDKGSNTHDIYTIRKYFRMSEKRGPIMASYDELP